MTILTLLLGAIVTIVGATFEVALLAVTRIRLAELVSRRLRGDGGPMAWPLEVGRELAAASTTTAIGIVLIGGALPGMVSGLGIWEILLGLLFLAVPITLVSGYLLPRWLGQVRAERAVAILRPAIRPWALVLRLVLPSPRVDSDLRTVEREGAAVLPGSDSEIAMVGGAITFAERPVREVMTPRTDVVAVPEGARIQEITAAFVESGYSRLPVYRDSLDEIIGMVHAFDLFALRPGEPLPVRPVALAPASRACADLLLDMQRERRHLAVVLDEFGGTLGIVTLEDLLTALVGEIYDEAQGEPEPPKAPLMELDGAGTVEQLEEQLGTALPTGHATTIGGRLAELVGRIPQAGERFVIDALEFDVLAATPARVERLVVRPAGQSPIRISGEAP
ncbi:MAG: hemolysin family protein [Gemmatimonadota bacterium]